MDTNENNMSGRASYTKDEYRELIRAFHASESMQATFCREWNINPKTLARSLRAERQDNEVSFCEVELPTDGSESDELKICLPNGIEVMLTVASPEALSRILREVAGCLDERILSRFFWPWSRWTCGKI